MAYRKYFIVYLSVFVHLLWIIYVNVNITKPPLQSTPVNYEYESKVIFKEESKVTCKFEDTPPDIKWLNEEYPINEKVAQAQMTKCSVPLFITVNETRHLSFNKYCTSQQIEYSHDMEITHKKPLTSPIDIRFVYTIYNVDPV
jgi:hypothetical protein